MRKHERMNLSLYYRGRDLELKSHPHGKMFKPKANYTLATEQIKHVCQWLKDLRMADEYSSNMAIGADINKGRMLGMKSHDCNVLMECLLPITFSLLPTHVVNPNIEVSRFFKDLCYTTLKEDDLTRMKQNISIILCKLERIFPLAFFYSLEHLTVHLAYEARLGGPVH